MTKRTTVTIDTGLLEEAAGVLGTEKMSETIHAALEQVVLRERRRELARWELPGLTPERLAELRRARTWSE